MRRIALGLLTLILLVAASSGCFAHGGGGGGGHRHGHGHGAASPVHHHCYSQYATTGDAPPGGNPSVRPC